MCEALNGKRAWSPLPVRVTAAILMLVSVVVVSFAQTSSLTILPAYTPVILRLKNSLYKKDAKPGQPVEFEVGFDVLVNGQVSIQSGAVVIGSVRKVDQTGKGPAKVLIDLGPAQTISREMVPLAPTRTAKTGDHFDPTFAFEFPPIIPVFLVARFFEKKVLLDKDAEGSWLGCWGCGVWVVAHVAENVALDPAKLKAAQAQYTTQQRAVEIELCRLLQSPNPDSSRYAGALFSFLSETKTQFKARLLEQAGDLDAATEEYQQAPAFGPAVCHEK